MNVKHLFRWVSRINGTNQHIEQRISTLLPRKSDVQDGSHVGMVVPWLHYNGTDGVGHHNGIGALWCGEKDKVVATVPEGQILR